MGWVEGREFFKGMLLRVRGILGREKNVFWDGGRKGGRQKKRGRYWEKWVGDSWWAGGTKEWLREGESGGDACWGGRKMGMGEKGEGQGENWVRGFGKYEVEAG